SRDIKYLTAQSQSYLNNLAKQTLPFMFQSSIESIRNVIKESWSNYQSQDKSINMYQKIGALKLIKECHESVFHLIDEGPSIMYVKQLQEKIVQIESRSLR